MLCVMSLMSFRGRWIPSKMEPMIPGPSSTERGFPVRSTGSPTDTPAGLELRKTETFGWNYKKQCNKVYLMAGKIKDTGFLVDLDGGHVSLQPDDLSDQLAVAHAN